jgi:uncharacterized protein YifE (UPF0438 family)
VDFDADGRADVISGSWPGEVYLFRGMADGKFAKGEELTYRTGEKINVGNASAVFAADWDEDGDLDLISGDIHGNVHLVVNEGSRKKPVFDGSMLLKAEGMDIVAEMGDSGPVVADWDGDGRHDLIVGCGDGSVVWFRNVGERGQPTLAKGETIIEAGEWQYETNDPSNVGRGVRAKACVADFNGDGVADLLVGDYAARTWMRDPLTEEEQKAFEVVKRKYEAAQAQMAKLWEKFETRFEEATTEEARQALYEEWSKETEGFQEEYSKVYREYAKFEMEQYEANGHVWVFLRNKDAIRVTTDGVGRP